jgi:hypothetical protein
MRNGIYNGIMRGKVGCSCEKYVLLQQESHNYSCRNTRFMLGISLALTPIHDNDDMNRRWLDLVRNPTRRNSPAAR